MSMKLTPATFTRTSTSPAFGTGTGTSSACNTSGPPWACRRIAFMRAREASGPRISKLRWWNLHSVHVEPARAPPSMPRARLMLLDVLLLETELLGRVQHQHFHADVSRDLRRRGLGDHDHQA